MKLEKAFKFYDVSNHVIRDTLIHFKNQNICDTISLQTAKFGHSRWKFISFEI